MQLGSALSYIFFFYFFYLKIGLQNPSSHILFNGEMPSKFNAFPKTILRAFSADIIEERLSSDSERT